MNVVSLYETNFRNVPDTLRELADDIEASKFGAVGCCAVALLGDTLQVFGMGPDSDSTSVACVLSAGANKLLRAIENHGIREA